MDCNSISFVISPDICLQTLKFIINTCRNRLLFYTLPNRVIFLEIDVKAIYTCIMTGCCPVTFSPKTSIVNREELSTGMPCCKANYIFKWLSQMKSYTKNIWSSSYIGLLISNDISMAKTKYLALEIQQVRASKRCTQGINFKVDMI